MKAGIEALYVRIDVVSDLVRLIDLGRFGSSYGVSEVFRRTEANVG